MTPFNFPARAAIAIAACLMIAAPVTAAGNLYRYTDESGNPVISHTLPQDASRRGYQILNSSGRVVDTVAPALTDEERAAKKALEEEQRRQAELAKQRLLADRQLLRTYSHPDDAVRALRRKLEQMQSLISLKQGNIANLQSQIRQEQSRAADIERAGREIPEQIPQKIESLQAEIRETELEIRRQETAIAKVVAEYEAKVVRLEELTKTHRTLPLQRPDAQS
jgi:chromosome segregation ATPase